MKRCKSHDGSLRSKLSLFIKEECGSTMIIVGLSFLALVGSTGIAIDMARAQLAQSKLSSSLDAAGLAAGSTVSTANLTSEATKYLNANYQDYMSSDITDFTVSVNSDQTIITLSATAELPTTFMKIFGISSVTVRADSEITRAVSGLELVLVLDNTGSMEGTKIADLKVAAHELINILYGNKETVDDLYIGLVPFAQAVNIGSTRTSWMDTTYLSSLNWGITSWGGCVDARSGSYDRTDDPPSVQKFLAYYWPDDSNNDWRRDDGSYRSITSTRGPNKYCSQRVTPMTTSKTTIRAGIDAMTTNGNTHVNLGAVWGWRMLSPRWRGLWGGEMDTHSLPLDYNTPRMNKAVIIMTDGDNTMSNSSHTAYWYLRDGKLGTTTQSTAEARLDSRLSTVCTSMKNNNILVYTIGFGNPGTTISNLLRNCATQTDWYFDSPTSTELNQAFRAIGDSLSNLRVSH